MKLCSFQRSRCVLLLLSVIALANLSALVDLFRHPEIPYFDMEHIIVGCITACTVALLLFSLNLQNRTLEKTIAEHDSLKGDFQESELKFKMLAENSPDMVHLNNKQGEILFVNPITETLLGYTKEELIGKSAGELVHPDHKKIVQDDMHHIFSHNPPPLLREIRLLKKDGTSLPVEVHGFVIDMGNDTKYIGAILRDISERIENEKKSHAIQEWSHTFDSMLELISVHDKDSKIIRANQAFCNFTGKSREELIGTHCFEIIHGTNHPWHDCPHQKTLTSLQPEKSEVLEPNSGITFEVTCTPLLGKKQELIGSVHTMRDVSTAQNSNTKKNLFPICSNCKNIRDNTEEWHSFEDYFFKELALKFTHSICPDCIQELYPELFNKNET